MSLGTRSMLLALALSVCVLALGDAERSLGADLGTRAQVGKTADGLALYVWDPNQSWPGRPQFDPRLEARVTLWRTGILLPDVFAAVHEQAGVEIGFFPPDDENRRVCVNVYLNPEAPPSLRELMVQLGWVTDCAFAWASDGETMSYHLLSTSIGSAVEQKIEDERHAAFVADQLWQREYAQRRAELKEKLLARLPELKKALGLTREEAIKAYRGKEDLLLLAVLDPGRRAIAQLVTSLSPEQLAEFKRDLLGARLARWTPGQRGYIREALGLALPAWLADRQRLGMEPNGQWGDWAWVERTDATVHVATDGTGFGFFLEEPLDVESPVFVRRIPHQGPRLGFLQLLVDPRATPLMGPESQVDLRRLLGEEIGAEEVRRIHREYHSSLNRAERKRYLEAVLADVSTLSARVSALLSSTTLPVEPSESYLLWQIQEATAAHSGLHVISDCFYQPYYSIGRNFSALYPNAEAEPTAEMVLQLSCCPRYAYPGLVRELVGEKGWEWGDAGSFLRFRSRERDTWRAVLLPLHVYEALDGWLQPHLPQPLPDDGSLPAVRVPLDLSQGIWLLSQLTSLQRAWGGKLIYCDPSDGENAYRHVYRATMLRLVWSLGAIYRILGELTEDQWKRVRGEGLVWGVDFSPAVAKDDQSWGFWLDRKRGDVLRLADTEPNALRRLPGGAVPPVVSAAGPTTDPERPLDKTPAVIVLRDGKPIAGDALPDRVSVRPRLAVSLVEHH